LRKSSQGLARLVVVVVRVVVVVVVVVIIVDRKGEESDGRYDDGRYNNCSMLMGKRSRS